MNSENRGKEENREQEKQFWSKILSWFADEVAEAQRKAKEIGGRDSILALQEDYDLCNYSFQEIWVKVETGDFGRIPPDAMEKLKKQTENLIAKYKDIIDTTYKA